MEFTSATSVRDWFEDSKYDIHAMRENGVDLTIGIRRVRLSDTDGSLIFEFMGSVYRSGVAEKVEIMPTEEFKGFRKQRTRGITENKMLRIVDQNGNEYSLQFP